MICGLAGTGRRQARVMDGQQRSAEVAIRGSATTKAAATEIRS
jgi:hypothetical protein